MYPVLFSIKNFTITHFIIVSAIYLFMNALIHAFLFYKKKWDPVFISATILYYIPILIVLFFLYKFKEFDIRSYSALYSIGFITGLLFVQFAGDMNNINRDKALHTSIVIAVCGIIGARIFFIFNNIASYKHISEIFRIWEGGFNFPGGLFLATVGALVFLKLNRLNLLKYTDFLFRAFALTHFLGKVGCFFNGCCYGTCTALPLGVKFPQSHYFTGPDAYIHPIQLYIALSILLFFFVAEYLSRKKIFHGSITAIYGIWYGATRFLTEFLRGDETAKIRPLLNLATTQWISLFFFFAGIILFLIFFYRNKWQLFRVTDLSIENVNVHDIEEITEED